MFEIAVAGFGLTGLYSFMRSLTLFSAYEMVFMMNFLSAGDSLSQLSMTLRRLATASASRSIRMASSFSSSAVY